MGSSSWGQVLWGGRCAQTVANPIPASQPVNKDPVSTRALKKAAEQRARTPASAHSPCNRLHDLCNRSAHHVRNAHRVVHITSPGRLQSCRDFETKKAQLKAAPFRESRSLGLLHHNYWRIGDTLQVKSTWIVEGRRVAETGHLQAQPRFMGSGQLVNAASA